jgi:hypothetical protein
VNTQEWLYIATYIDCGDRANKLLYRYAPQRRRIYGFRFPLETRCEIIANGYIKTFFKVGQSSKRIHQLTDWTQKTIKKLASSKTLHSPTFELDINAYMVAHKQTKMASHQF